MPKKKAPAKKPEVFFVPAPYVAKPPIGRGSVTIVQLKPRSCRWPFGENPPFLYCGCMTVEGRPYCEDHMKLGHVRWQAATVA